MNENSIVRFIRRREVYYISPNNPNGEKEEGSEQRLGRPVLVISNDMANMYSPVVEVVSMTLQKKPDLPTHVLIDEGRCAGSTVLCEQIKSVSVERLGNYLCTIDEETMDEIDYALAVSIDINCYIDEVIELRKEVKDLKGRLNNTIVKETVAVTKGEQPSPDIIEGQIYRKMYNELIDKLILGGGKNK
jgi:mRNA interferase MazF